MKKKHKIIGILIASSISLSLFGCSMISFNKENLNVEVNVEVSDDINENATTFMNFFKEYNSNGMYAMGSDKFKESIEKKVISDQNRSIKKQFGTIESFSDFREVLDSGYKTILAYTVFEKGSYDVRISFSEDGKQIEGYALQESPIDGEKVDTKTYSGEPVSFDSGKYQLHGTLLLPKNIQGKVPVVVMLQGSGGSDRDETIYGLNKPFRDIAEGLAAKGIGVLRYDKRSYTYGGDLSEQEINDMSIDDEIVDDFLASVSYLKTRQEFDPDKIFVLGHSLSGYLLPYIYDKEPSIKGGISLAGTIGMPFEDLMKYQYEYLANYDDKISKDEQATLDEFNIGYELVKNLKNGEEISEPLILGIGQNYWNFLNKYDGLKEWKTIVQPTLVLQGERDYQMPIKSYNLYKEELGSAENFTFKSYKKLSHIFMNGSKKPTPNDYTKKDVVDKNVIKDIVKWINDVNKLK